MMFDEIWLRKGTTSAYAEKSLLEYFFEQEYWNYLRIRGEEVP